MDLTVTATGRPVLPKPYQWVKVSKHDSFTLVTVEGKQAVRIEHDYFPEGRQRDRYVAQTCDALRTALNDGAPLNADPSDTHLHRLHDTVAQHGGKITGVQVNQHAGPSQRYTVKGMVRDRAFIVSLNDKGYFYRASWAGGIYEASTHRGYKSHTTKQVFDLLLENFGKKVW